MKAVFISFQSIRKIWREWKVESFSFFRVAGSSIDADNIDLPLVYLFLLMLPLVSLIFVAAFRRFPSTK